MANELIVAMRVWDNANADGLTQGSLGIDRTGIRYVRHKQLIGITEEVLDLGELASLGVFIARNDDPTNYLEIRSGTGAGNDIHKFLPGETWAWRWGSDVTAPFAIANTAACYLTYLCFEI